MSNLFLLRHIKSQWNKENRFAGWSDGPLDENEVYDAKTLRDKVFIRYRIDSIYCSSLFRNMDTIARMFDFGSEKYPIFVHLDGGKMQKWGHYIDISDNDVPVFVSEKLNERYYGKLQGMDKEEAIKKYGDKIVHLWRRSYKVAPPGGESLKDVFKRTIPFYRKYIEKDLKKGENVLIVASHNSLRAIAKYIEKISDEKIIDFEIPYAGLIKYEFDGKLKLIEKIIL
ncbi:histidine phosphatase family protein [Patescibacteria group bacterium]|nr:histidine phosphatase family protein [Patescibacteria group bacterium]MBU4274792.1 histidine phosphatase family protein [Patescibacteria group bacterium]MBU4367792.1 histidine phosphatase family protein [Patescibacteria group bacterium]MBU4461482.1 histidine phosphatase family protein [Patescibacteria group bacterium]MCG2700386.1 histidine phosphatase family protein [Candidatus Parcubacteria bacterium]